MEINDTTLQKIDAEKTNRTIIHSLAFVVTVLIASITYGINSPLIHGRNTPAHVQETDDTYNKEVLKDIRRVLEDDETSVRGKTYIISSYATKLRTDINASPYVHPEKNAPAGQKEVDITH